VGKPRESAQRAVLRRNSRLAARRSGQLNSACWRRITLARADGLRRDRPALFPRRRPFSAIGDVRCSRRIRLSRARCAESTGATGLEPATSGVTVGWSATVEFRIPTTIPPLRPITKRRSGYANLCVACTSFRPKRRSWAFSSDPASIDVGGSAQDARLAPECEGDPGRDWRYRRSSRASEISASPRLPCRCPEHQRRRHLRDACIPRKGAKPGWRLEPGASGGRFSPLPPL
jgi:hypothetical protein